MAKILLDVTGKIQTLEWFQARQKGITSTGSYVALDNYLHKHPEEAIFLPDFWEPVSYETGSGMVEVPDPMDFGLCKYGNTPMSVFLDKTTPIMKVPDPGSKKDSFVLDVGTVMEPLVRDLYEDMTGYRVSKPECIFQDEEFDFILDEPDGIVELPTGEKRCLEIKTTSSVNLSGWNPGVYGEGGMLPNHYYVQCVQHMRVMGLEKCTVVCCYGFNSGSICVVQIARDPDMEMLLVRAETDFWNEHVLKGIAPDGGLSDEKLSERKSHLWKKLEETKPLSEENRELFGRYYSAKAELENAEAFQTAASAAVFKQTARLFDCKSADELSDALEVLKALEADKKSAGEDVKRLKETVNRMVNDILVVVGDAANGKLPLSDELEVEVSNRVQTKQTLDADRAKFLLTDLGYDPEMVSKTSTSYVTRIAVKKTRKEKKGK